MGNRDTSDIYTGLTSSSARRISQSRQKASDEKLSDQAQVNTLAEPIRKIFDAELAKIKDISGLFVGIDVTNEQYQLQMAVRKDALERITRMKTDAENLFRKNTRVRRQQKAEVTDER